jgi:type II secretory pathway pseudopilin PulG
MLNGMDLVRERNRRAASLIETLVCIAIISIMMSMLLPALFRARNNAVRMQCENNLYQLDLAFRQFREMHKADPFTNQSNIPGGWTVDILPFLEQDNLAHSFNFRQRLDGPANLPSSGFLPKVMHCPFQGLRDSRVAGVPATDYVLVVRKFDPGDPSSSSLRPLAKDSRFVSFQDAPDAYDAPWVLGPEMLETEAMRLRGEHAGPHPDGEFLPVDMRPHGFSF